MRQKSHTSWNNSSKWYNKIVGNEGHYYHEHVVLPGLKKLLKVTADSRVLDLGCGQGVLARALPKYQHYLGIDAAPDLISAAKRQTRSNAAEFQVADATRPLKKIELGTYTHVACVLALQNMEHPEGTITNAAAALRSGGQFVIVLNHPSFRIPRQSGWKNDEKSKQQYRWENRYLSPLKIPIQMSPGADASKVTWSFHRPLQDYTQMLAQAGMVITDIQEWTSDKESVGKAAKSENRARNEFPLFMTIVAEKR